MKIEIGFAPKTVDLKNGMYLHFWYSNNKGRGSNNVTIIKSTSNVRASMSRNQSDVIEKTLTSAWSGNVNFSKNVQDRLGLDN